MSLLASRVPVRLAVACARLFVCVLGGAPGLDFGGPQAPGRYTLVQLVKSCMSSLTMTASHTYGSDCD